MHNPHVGLGLLGAVAFLVNGPYSRLAGAIAVDLGGRRATAAGLIDTAGYLGAVASGILMGALAQQQGWSAAFRLLATSRDSPRSQAADAGGSGAVRNIARWRTRRGMPMLVDLVAFDVSEAAAYCGDTVHR